MGVIHATPTNFEEAVETILSLTSKPEPALVVTPNIAHVWQAESSEPLREAYRRAAFAPVDGWPLVRAIKMLAPGTAIERVPGADLLVALCNHDLSVSLIGGSGDSAATAAKKLLTMNPELKIAGVELAPPAY